jgi:Holliday junction resolvase-like predicted endonuclease
VKSKLNKRQFGSTRELLVRNYLFKHGYKLLEANYYIGNLGEIDLIVKSIEKELVFVEVRSHTTDTIHSSQILSAKKLKRLQFLARLWLKKQGLAEYETNWRIDLIVVSSSRKISWYKSIC